MKYTLDSIKHVQSALEASYRDKTIVYNPVIYVGNELLRLAENPKNLFFGVLTAGEKNYCQLTYRGAKLLEVDPGSQIIELFSNTIFQDAQGTLIPEPEGIFRGFEIQIT